MKKVHQLSISSLQSEILDIQRNVQSENGRYKYVINQLQHEKHMEMRTATHLQVERDNLHIVYTSLKAWLTEIADILPPMPTQLARAVKFN